MVIIANTKIMQNMLIWDINKTYDSNGTAVTLYKMLQDFQGKEFTVSAVPYEQIITWGEMKKLGIV